MGLSPIVQKQTCNSVLHNLAKASGMTSNGHVYCRYKEDIIQKWRLVNRYLLHVVIDIRNIYIFSSNYS